MRVTTASPELRQLRYFVAVAEELNFTRAARRMHLVQQALSGAISQFEHQLGVQLFARTTRRVELTDAGTALLPHAREALAAADRAVSALVDVVAGRTGRLRLGLAMTSGLPLTPVLLRELDDDRPDIELTVRHFDLRDPSGGLADGTSDVAIVRPPLALPDLCMIELAREPRYAVLGSTHPLATEPDLRLDQLVDEPWAEIDADPAWRDHWLGAEQRSRPSPVGPLCSSIDDVFETARSLRGTALVPESIATAQHWAELSFVPVVDVPPSSVVVAWRGDDRRPLVQHFVALATRHQPLAA
jgi:DNA-binding transcriptional LysR family regulator